MNSQCKEHGDTMKLVPSGISKKTGRQYNAFNACTVPGCKQTAPATNEPSVAPQKPLTSVGDNEEMKRVDWNKKEYIKGLAVFSSNERSQGMSPVEATRDSHVWDWLYVAYGDMEGFKEWQTEARTRIHELSAGREAKRDLVRDEEYDTREDRNEED